MKCAFHHHNTSVGACTVLLLPSLQHYCTQNRNNKKNLTVYRNCVVSTLMQKKTNNFRFVHLSRPSATTVSFIVVLTCDLISKYRHKTAHLFTTAARRARFSSLRFFTVMFFFAAAASHVYKTKRKNSPTVSRLIYPLVHQYSTSVRVCVCVYARRWEKSILAHRFSQKLGYSHTKMVYI